MLNRLPGPVATAARPAPRRGVSAVEFAIVLPFLGFLVMGIAEFGRALTARQVLNDAVRKGCRTGVLPNRTSAQITSDVNDILADNGITKTDVTITIQVNGKTVDASTAVQND